LTPHESLLDTLVTLPAEERSGLKKLSAICDAVTQTSKTHVVVGTVPFNVLLQYRDRRGATSQKARDVLVDLLDSAKHDQNLTWRLLYDPEMKEYWLNVHLVPIVKAMK